MYNEELIDLKIGVDMTDPRISKLAHLLVDYSTDVQHDDQVLIWAPGSTTSMPLLLAIYERVLERGGHPHIAPYLRGAEDIFFEHAQNHQLDYVSPLYKLAVDTFDVIIRVEGVNNTRELSQIDPVKQVRQRQAYKQVQQTYLERGDKGDLSWNVTLFPTNALAQEADMSLRNYQNFVYDACHVNKDKDPIQYWQAVQIQQDHFLEWLQGHDIVEVKGSNIDLSFSIKDRDFINACGKLNMPDGEIFTGPVEASVNGYVHFTYPVNVGGREIDNIKLKFDEGKVVQASASKNEGYLMQMLDTDIGARYLGEWAIGTNYGIDHPTKQILFDEKMGGTVHMAIGSGYPLTGSKNVSAIHWDMICDMKADGEIKVDGELIYKSGKFLI